MSRSSVLQIMSADGNSAVYADPDPDTNFPADWNHFLVRNNNSKVQMQITMFTNYFGLPCSRFTYNNNLEIQHSSSPFLYRDSNPGLMCDTRLSAPQDYRKSMVNVLSNIRYPILSRHLLTRIFLDIFLRHPQRTGCSTVSKRKANNSRNTTNSSVKAKLTIQLKHQKKQVISSGEAFVTLVLFHCETLSCAAWILFDDTSNVRISLSSTQGSHTTMAQRSSTWPSQ